jgi:PAS domain S-box-containing protein
MNSQPRTSGDAWLFAGVWGLAAILITVLGLFYLGYQRTVFRRTAQEQLSAIADTKVQQIVDWRNERLGDARTIMLDPFFPKHVQRFLEQPSDLQTRELLSAWLQAVRLHNQSLRAMLLDSDLRLRLVSPPDKAYPEPGPAYTMQAARSNQVVISDLHREGNVGGIHLDVAIPLHAAAPSEGPPNLSQGQAVGVIDLELDPRLFLYPLLQAWPTPSRTAETLLIRRQLDEVLYLNEARHCTNSALTLGSHMTETNAVVVQALLGRLGPLQGDDYRAESVIAEARAVPGTPWTLLVKMDEHEVFSALRTRNWIILAVILALVLGAGLASWALWRHVEARRLATELSERKRAEAELARERDLLTTLLESTPDAIYFKDLRSRFVRCSHSFKTLFNVTDLSLVIGRTDFDFFAKEHAQPAFDDEQQIIRTGVPMIGKQERELYSDGRIKWALTSKMPWRDKHGTITGTVGISKDITGIKDAEARLEAARSQLLETSRLAGMAEVATSVLHNVGNVLNSVNTSATLVFDQVKQSKIVNLARVTALLREHPSDLADFLTLDPKGRTVPAYLTQLSEHLLSEQTTALNELESLRSHIEHIKDIVLMQQSYAKVGGVREPVNPADLVEDALRMNASGLERRHVQIRRQYDPHVPQVTIEKHKVLQILVNLIRNAEYACDESGRPDKCLAVSVANGNGRIKIAVTDNGVGIPPENLTRIFNHGFTTRTDGHGFGLHSGALAANELGGSLKAHSDGPGTGASFTLELPV